MLEAVLWERDRTGKMLIARVACYDRFISAGYDDEVTKVTGVGLISGVGAAVLAHSLRDCDTTKKLAVLVCYDTLRQSTIDELRACPTTKQIHCLKTY